LGAPKSWRNSFWCFYSFIIFLYFLLQVPTPCFPPRCRPSHHHSVDSLSFKGAYRSQNSLLPATREEGTTSSRAHEAKTWSFYKKEKEKINQEQEALTSPPPSGWRVRGPGPNGALLPAAGGGPVVPGRRWPDRWRRGGKRRYNRRCRSEEPGRRCVSPSRLGTKDVLRGQLEGRRLGDERWGGWRVRHHILRGQVRCIGGGW
jgi:hypothetical protein